MYDLKVIPTLLFTLLLIPGLALAANTEKSDTRAMPPSYGPDTQIFASSMVTAVPVNMSAGVMRDQPSALATSSYAIKGVVTASGMWFASADSEAGAIIAAVILLFLPGVLKKS